MDNRVFIGTNIRSDQHRTVQKNYDSLGLIPFQDELVGLKTSNTIRIGKVPNQFETTICMQRLQTVKMNGKLMKIEQEV